MNYLPRKILVTGAAGYEDAVVLFAVPRVEPGHYDGINR
jgi:hypothetical protein